MYHQPVFLVDQVDGQEEVMVVNSVHMVVEVVEVVIPAFLEE
jgi:hypothetical protein